MSETAELDQNSFSLTQAAISRIADIIDGEEGGGIFRVAVHGGGCSGFQYTFNIDYNVMPDDLVLQHKTQDGAEIIIAIDTMSIEFLKGSRLDYVQELIGNYFQVSNPNATASCGCGTSFAL